MRLGDQRLICYHVTNSTEKALVTWLIALELPNLKKAIIHLIYVDLPSLFLRADLIEIRVWFKIYSVLWRSSVINFQSSIFFSNHSGREGDLLCRDIVVYARTVQIIVRGTLPIIIFRFNYSKLITWVWGNYWFFTKLT